MHILALESADVGFLHDLDMRMKYLILLTEEEGYLCNPRVLPSDAIVLQIECDLHYLHLLLVYLLPNYGENQRLVNSASNGFWKEWKHEGQTVKIFHQRVCGIVPSGSQDQLQFKPAQDGVSLCLFQWFGQLDLHPLPGASPQGIALKLSDSPSAPTVGEEAFTKTLFHQPDEAENPDSFCFLLKQAENLTSFCFLLKQVKNLDFLANDPSRRDTNGQGMMTRDDDSNPCLE
ncbi:hypothetical protein IEQ34_018713 [Dendrobium chrysotoxum]|uniref:Uncharacterized protein n=1 Tax=Dendrobium chrysotoxum TaxID=161865 RepID=A0AAV7G6W5_DENCH|nr:hypothetical protein IEQ34_018713 [Dendrobium chrysotoxum]